jgi:serine/threonine protein kinase
MLPLLHVVPQKVWHLILSFCGNVAHHNMLQVCRKAQLSVPLPHAWGDTWDAFFTDGQFLSKGANGSVYKSTLRNDPKRSPVAVKVIQKNTIFSLRKWHHIQREIDALTACKHPHVIELVRVAQSPEAVFIVLQYAQGGDLFDWLMSRKAPSEAEVKPIAQQLLSTLHFMHEVCGAVHRDIKPENILLEKRVRGSETPTVRLADFGFARVFPQLAKTGPVPLTVPRHNPANDLTVAATPCGTLGFAAPEIIVAYSNRKEHLKEEEELQKKGAHVSTPNKKAPASPDTPVELMKKMDIFAAGVTICILLTGCEPFPCHSSKAHLEAVNEGASFEGRQWSHVSPEAKDLLRRMLHPAATKRPSSLDCLQSKWLTTGMRQAVLSARAEEDAELAKSFQQSIRSLKKNDGMMLVHDKSGAIQRRNRQDVLEETLHDEPPVAPPGPQFTKPAAPVPINPRQQAVHSQPAEQEQHVGSLDVFIE